MGGKVRQISLEGAINFRPSGPPDEPFKIVDIHGVCKELAEPPYATVGIQRYAHYRDAFRYFSVFFVRNFYSNFCCRNFSCEMIGIGTGKFCTIKKYHGRITHPQKN